MGGTGVIAVTRLGHIVKVVTDTILYPCILLEITITTPVIGLGPLRLLIVDTQSYVLAGFLNIQRHVHVIASATRVFPKPMWNIKGRGWYKNQTDFSRHIQYRCVKLPDAEVEMY